MKTLKKVLLVLAVILVVFVGVGMMLPREVKVERTAEVQGSPQAAFELVNTLKNWDLWSPWHRIDPNQVVTYSAESSGEGAWYTWNSTHPDVGNGKLTILNTDPHAVINTQLDFEGMGSSKADYFFKPTEKGTQVTMTMETDMGAGPVGRYFGLMMDKWIGEDYEKCLANMDSVLRANPMMANPVAPTMDMESMGTTEILTDSIPAE